MSVFTGKHVTFIGSTSSEMEAIKSLVDLEGAQSVTVNSDEVDSESFKFKNGEIVFIDYTDQTPICTKILKDLTELRTGNGIPVFAMVNDNQIDIERVLSLGAADYFTESESAKSIIDKVRIVLGEPVNSAENKVINIGLADLSRGTTGIRVFLVEDDSLLANLLTTSFERAKFPLHVNSDGKDIIKQIDEFKPDIVILDLMLPGISGLEVLKQIRNNSKYKSLPVIIFSNRDSSEDRQQAAELGVSGFYVKAMTDLAVLVKRIEKVVS